MHHSSKQLKSKQGLLGLADIGIALSGWPRTLENRKNGEKKFPAGKNQGI